MKLKKLSNLDNPESFVEDPTYPDMYRLKWIDGVFSEDMYNLTRVKDILANYAVYRYNMRKTFPKIDQE